MINSKITLTPFFFNVILNIVIILLKRALQFQIKDIHCTRNGHNNDLWLGNKNSQIVVSHIFANFFRHCAMTYWIGILQPYNLRKNEIYIVSVVYATKTYWVILLWIVRHRVIFMLIACIGYVYFICSRTVENQWNLPVDVLVRDVLVTWGEVDDST